ncbi:MAG: ubiquinone/menaquinone biosynthesis methyltransferase [Oligoflexia bacterium]|nr:ubiquinone/menaquinone biosynthesis methyltransferase [Oligoflexia bacterium]
MNIIQMFSRLSSRYDFLNRIFSFGMDYFWRKAVVQELVLFPQDKVHMSLDLATGSGELAFMLADCSKVEKVIGIDLSQQMIEVANHKRLRKLMKLHLPQLQVHSNLPTFEVGDAVNIPFAGSSFDLVTIAFGIRNFCDVKRSLIGIERILKKGGYLIILEFSLQGTDNQFLKSIYWFYLWKIMPLIGGIIAREKDAYKYLAQTIERFPGGENFSTLVSGCGLQRVKIRKFFAVPVYLYIFRKH